MSACARCGAELVCAMVDRPDDTAPCWCAQLPVVKVEPQPGDGEGCLCPACLKAELEKSRAKA